MGHGPGRPEPAVQPGPGLSLRLGPGLAGRGPKIYFPPMGYLQIDFCDDFAATCAPFAPNNLISEKISQTREIIFDQNRCDSEIGVIR